MSTGERPKSSKEIVELVERNWAILVSSIIFVLVATVIFTGLHWAMMPPSRVETIDISRINREGEFVESNLGSAAGVNGSVIVRVLAQQYSFTPQCILVPTDTEITFRATSADVIHGMLITDTNINSMIEPGYVSTFKSRFRLPSEHLMPCHEFCGTGHQAMWAHVKVVEKKAFFQMLARKGADGRLNCAD